MSFLPEDYAAVPRQCFYHTVTYLNTVDAGNAALMVVPGSAELSRSIVATLSKVCACVCGRTVPAPTRFLKTEN